MQAVITQYIHPTTYRPARTSARSSLGSALVDWNYSLTQEENHREAAKTLATNLGFPGYWTSVDSPYNGSKIYVFTDNAAA